MREMNGRRVGRGLALSIALNVFLVGLIVGVALHRQESAMSPAGAQLSSTDIVRPFVQLAGALPREDGRALRESFRTRLPELVRLQRRSLQAAEQVRHDIGQKDLDMTRLREDLQAAREARLAIRPVIEGALVDALPRMSPAGRKILSEYRFLADR